MQRIVAQLRQDDDEVQHVDALGQLCELLSVSTEDSLSMLPVETLAPTLVSLTSLLLGACSSLKQGHAECQLPAGGHAEQGAQPGHHAAGSSCTDLHGRRDALLLPRNCAAWGCAGLLCAPAGHRVHRPGRAVPAGALW